MNYCAKQRQRRFIFIVTLLILLLLCIVYNIHFIQTYYYSNFSIITTVKNKNSYNDNTHLQFSLWLAEHVNTTTINSTLTIANRSTTTHDRNDSISNIIVKDNTKLNSSDSSSVVNTTSLLTYTTKFQKKLDSIIVPKLWMKHNIQIRSYPIWNTVYNRSTISSNDLPCYRPTLGSINTSLWYESKLNQIRSIPIKEGLFFVKLYKTASSTSASIHVRIAHNLANRMHNNNKINTSSNNRNDSETTSTTSNNDTNYTNEYWPVCRTRHLHGPAGTSMYKFHQRTKQYSFIWTMIRHPTERYISEFFHFEVSRHPTKNYSNISSDLLLRYIRYGKHSNRHSIHYLSLSNERYTKKLQNDNVTSSTKLQNTIQTILDEYDFIGIMERFDESIVVLMLLLNIPMADVLYMSSKLNGGWDPYISETSTNHNTAPQCTKIQPSIITKEVQEYITNSTDWYQYIEPENILYVAANEQLDKTILNTIGIIKFQQTLQLYQSIQQYIQLKCTFNYTYTSYTCNPYNGTLITDNNCIHKNTDIGCGFTCLDEIATEMNLW